MTERRARPGSAVLDAFGASAPLVALSGGQGTSWRSGGVVLKPLDSDGETVVWLESVLSGTTTSDRVRWTRPIRSRSGDLIVDGWTAWDYVAGQHQPNRWGEIIAAGEAFAEALQGIEAPAFLERRQDPWAVADRVAWGEATLDDLDRIPHVAGLRSALAPVRAAPHLVHGDLAGNVLFDPTLPPAVIDPSLYWRPVGYASAIVVVDAMSFHSATLSLFDPLTRSADFDQYLIRALLFRLVTDHLRNTPAGAHSRDPYVRVVEAVHTLVRPASRA